MLKNEKHQEIINILKQQNYCTVKQLSKMLYISESSVRRYLSYLEKNGLIKRSYGGAELIAGYVPVASFNERIYNNVSLKQCIAKKAAELIKPGNVLFLDQSSTSMFLAREIVDKQDLTVVTNNLEILKILSSSTLTVYSSGGRLIRNSCNGFVGEDAENTFRNIFADLCFFSTKSISNDGAITDCYKEEISVRNAMLKNSKQRVFLCDSSKFNTKSVFKQCDVADVDYIITDERTNDFLKVFENLTMVL